MEVLFETEALKVLRVPGNGASAIVSFSGIMQAVGIPGASPAEFKKTMQQIGTDADVYYVTDLRSQWYNYEIFATIVETVNSCFRERGTQVAYTVGNSMGGFAAIAFAKELRGVKRCLAFAPQSSASTEIVPEDRRWVPSVKDVRRWAVKDAARALSDEVDYFVFAGTRDHLDMLHLARLKAANPTHVLPFPVGGSNHRVAGDLKARGLLAPILGDVLNGKSTGTASISVWNRLKTAGLVGER